jgi:hypothetical protein
VRPGSADGRIGAEGGQVEQKLAADARAPEEPEGSAAPFAAVGCRIIGQVLEADDIAHGGFRYYGRVVQRWAAKQFVVCGVQS